MYELVEVEGELFLAKMDYAKSTAVSIAQFIGSPHEIRETAKEMVGVLNASLSVQEKHPEVPWVDDSVGECKDEARLDGTPWGKPEVEEGNTDEAWKPATESG